MSDLPENWIETEIGGLCSLKNGRAFKPVEWKTSGLPIVRIQNLNNPTSAFNYFQGEVDERNRLRGGELLFAWSGTPGTSFGAHVWYGGEAVLNQHIFRVDFDEALLDKRFFRSAINQKLSELIDVAHGGVGLRHVTKGVFEKTLVALPPRPEQTRIANQLDTLLTRVQACKDRFDAIPALLKRFRQAVLSAATSGELTEQWRGQTGANIATWNSVPIGDLIEEIQAGLNVQCEERPPMETEKGLIKISAVTWGRFDEDESKTLPANSAVSERVRIRKGDFLISRANTVELVGACVIVGEVHKNLYLSDKVLRLVVEERLKPWLLFCLRSQSGRQQIESLASGNQLSMRNLSQANLKSIVIPMPLVEEQVEIVRRVEAMFAFADRIEARCTDARTQAQRLAPLVLAKAFRGELVEQDLRDEPASVLLQRIAAAPPVKTQTLRGRPRVNKSESLPLPLATQSNWATLPDNTWTAPADPKGHASAVLLVAVLKAWGRPMPQVQARLATLLCQQPRLFTAVLPVDQGAQWRRLVGIAAEPLPAQVASVQPAINSQWRRALAGMRARGDLIESGSGQQATWVLGAGAVQIQTAGWPDGRAAWVVAHLQSCGVETILPALEPAAREFVNVTAAA